MNEVKSVIRSIIKPPKAEKGPRNRNELNISTERVNTHGYELTKEDLVNFLKSDMNLEFQIRIRIIDWDRASPLAFVSKNLKGG